MDLILSIKGRALLGITYNKEERAIIIKLLFFNIIYHVDGVDSANFHWIEIR